MLSGMSGLSGQSATHRGSIHYFVDATNGDDSASGISPQLAWQTRTNPNGNSFNSADEILFNRGDSFSGELDPSCGGQTTRHLIFGAYGNGARPFFTGAMVITSWSNTVGEEYSASYAYTPGHVYADNDQLTLGSGAGSLNRGEYFYDAGGDLLHVRLSDGSDPNNATMEASRYTYGIDVHYSHSTFRDLEFDKHTDAGIFLRNGGLTDLRIENVLTSRDGYHSFRLGAAAGTNPNNVILRRCTAQLWDRNLDESNPAFYGQEGDGTGLDDLIIEYCTVDGWLSWGVNTNLNRNGIELMGGNNPIVRNSEITGCDHGIVLSDSVSRWDIYGNWIHEIADDGVFYRSPDSSEGRIYNNVFYRCSDQIMDQQDSVAGNMGLFAFNTCYEPLNGAINLLGNNGCTGTIRNNIFVVTQNDPHVNVMDVSSGIDIGDYVFENNLYYDTVNPPVDTDFAHFETANQTWAQWQAAGRDAGGITANPLLENAGGTDAEDYDIQSSSPAIGEATVITGITDDYTGTARGVLPDIGAFQFSST